MQATRPPTDDDGPQMGRRSHGRLRMELSATLTSRHGTHAVLITNLSRRGLGLQWLQHLPANSDVVVAWPMCEVSGSLVWSEEDGAGVVFDDPISEEIVLAARDQEAARQAEIAATPVNAWARENLRFNERRRWRDDTRYPR